MKKQIFEDGNRVLFETESKDELLLKFTDDIVDARGNVKGTVKNKGVTSAEIAVHLYKVLSSYHLPIRFRSSPSSKELTIRAASLFPFYVSVTNVEQEEGDQAPQVEYILLDEKGETSATPKELLAANAASQEQLSEMRRYCLKMNVILKDFFDRRDLILLGFRANFGILPSGKIGLCSELTLDTCDVKENGSRTKFTTSYIMSHMDDAADLYDKALSAILY